MVALLQRGFLPPQLSNRWTKLPVRGRRLPPAKAWSLNTVGRRVNKTDRASQQDEREQICGVLIGWPTIE